MVRTCAVSRLVSVTVAFGTTAPEVSFSVPVNAPVEADWLNSDGASIMEQRTKAKHSHHKMRPSQAPGNFFKH